jgi:hypothetical protein
VHSKMLNISSDDSQTSPSRSRSLLFWFKLYLLLLIFSPALFKGFATTARGITPDQVLLSLTFVYVLLRYPSYVRHCLRSRIGFCLVVFFLCATISGALSLLGLPDSSFVLVLAGLWGDSRPLLIYCVGWIFSTMLDDKARANLIGFLLKLGVVEMLVAVAQYIHWTPIIKLTSTLYMRALGQSSVLEGLVLGRVYGTFDGQPNSYGCFMVIIVSYALSLFVIGLRASTMVKYLCILLSAILGLALSWSRGSFAGAFASILVITLMYGGMKVARIGFVLLVSAVGLYYLLPSRILDRFSQLVQMRDYGGDSIFQQRLPYWHENIHLWLENPFFGVMGLKTAPLDSLYLGLLTTNGLVGAMCFLIVLLSVCYSIFKLLKVQNGTRSRAFKAICIATLAVTIGLLVNGVSVPSFFINRGEELYWLLVALVVSHTVPNTLKPSLLSSGGLDVESIKGYANRA